MGLLSRYGEKNNGIKKAMAVFVILVVLIFLLFSAYFVAYEADHECSGEDCPVCALLHISEDSLRQLGCGVSSLPAAGMLIFLIMVMRLCTDSCNIISTPVSRKTRLNN